MRLSRVLTVFTAALIAAVISLMAAPSVAEELLISPAPVTSAVEPGSVGMQLFMYNWNSVATECTKSLGPAGVKWVLVMPPQEHINGLAWWTHYQPVSYAIESNLGTRAEFAAMTAACNGAGVKVIADAVINHMSSSSVGIGWGGTSYTKYNYPGLYSESDFHACHNGIDWNDSASVQNCELLGLADLDTGSASVQGKIVAYLQDLLSLGVSGFRIDAAKHIAVSELSAIRSQLPTSATFINEVYDGNGIYAKDYLGVGDIFDFSSGYELKDALTTSGRAGTLAVRKQTLVALPPSDQVVTMVTNHDTERAGTTLSVDDGKQYVLANEALLTRTYGIPMLFSGFAYLSNDEAPLTAAGKVSNANCASAKTSVQHSYADRKFTCEQRWKAIRGMINWHNFVAGAAETNVYGKKAVFATGRGTQGYFLMNSGTKAFKSKLVSGMAAGFYCDLVSAGTNPFKGGGTAGTSGVKRKCAGLTVKVDAKHRLIAKVAAQSSVAITAASKLR